MRHSHESADVLIFVDVLDNEGARVLGMKPGLLSQLQKSWSTHKFSLLLPLSLTIPILSDS